MKVCKKQGRRGAAGTSRYLKCFCGLMMACDFGAARTTHAQVTLRADGPGNTYELLSSVLGGSPYEVPDCGHPEFGHHITEEWNAELGEYVFVFHMHVNEDNDRCVNFDRQRNEIKTYSPSPANVKGAFGEVHTYRWKFRLDAGFQPSPNFTHIFQIKAGDGSDAGAPIISITPRAGDPDTLQIIFTPSSGGSGGGVKASANLADFKGQWMEAYVRTLYTDTGTFEISLARVSDGAPLLVWSSSIIDMWRGDATFNRPKWGIYRSLNSSSYLRDEDVMFADFCIAEGTNTCDGDGPLLRLSSAPQIQSVFPGGGVNYTINVQSGLGPTNGVSLAISGLPANATASFNPAIGTNTADVVLSIAASSETPLGSYPLTIIGTTAAFTNFATATLVVSTNNEVWPDALVAHLTFDDGTANDSSGHGNNGTLATDSAGVAEIVDDPDRGMVLSLNGEGKVDLGNPTSMNVIGEITLAAWIKIAAVNASQHNIINRGHGGSPTTEVTLRLNGQTDYQGGNYLSGRDTGGGQFASYPIQTSDVGNWVHVAATAALVRDGTFTWRLYRNGELVDTQTGFDGALTMTVGWAIGARGGVSDVQRGFIGQLDDVCIYRAALPQTEIQTIMNPPTLPIVSALSRDAGGLWLSWTGGTPPYQVQVTTNLDAPTWQVFGELIRSNSLILSPSKLAEFYRIQGQ